MNRFAAIITAAGLAALVASPVVQAKEVTLKGISAWPKNFPLTGGDFLLFGGKVVSPSSGRVRKQTGYLGTPTFHELFIP